MDIIANDLDVMAVEFGHSLMESDLKQFEDSSSQSDTAPVLDDTVTNHEESFSSKPDTGNESYCAQNSTNLPQTSSKADKQSNQFVCTDCGVSYNKQSSLSNHRLSKHAFVCSTCGSRFGVRANYESHVQFGCGRTAPTAQQLECMVCHKILQSKKTLKKHLQHHYGIGEYRCKVCSRLFQQRTHLDQHMRTHDGYKPFACRLCGNSYTEKSSMMRHLRKIHSSNDPDLIENRVYEAVTASQKAAEKEEIETDDEKQYSYLSEEQTPMETDPFNEDSDDGFDTNENSLATSEDVTEINPLSPSRGIKSSAKLENVLGISTEIHKEEGNSIEFDIPERLPIDERDEAALLRDDESLDEDISDESFESNNFYEDEEDETPGVPPPDIEEIITERIKKEQNRLNIAYKIKQQEIKLEISRESDIVKELPLIKAPVKINKHFDNPIMNKILQVPVSRDCNICGKLLSSPSALRKHIARHEDEDAFKCVMCKKSFPTTVALQKHMLAHQFEKKIKCDFCKVLFTEKSTYRRHLRRFHNYTLDGARQYVQENCKELGPDDYLAMMNGSFCDDVAKDQTEESESEDVKPDIKTDLDHIQNQPNSLNESENNKSQSNTFFQEKLNFDASNSVKVENDSFEGKSNQLSTFEARDLVKIKSEKDINNEKSFSFLPEPKVYDCHLCGRLLGTGTSLRRHIKRHGDKFRCTVCKRNFPDSKILRQHMLVHNQHYLICTVCSKPMTERSRYRSHLRSVHGFTLEGAQAYVDGLIDIIPEIKTENKDTDDDLSKDTNISEQNENDDKTHASENPNDKLWDNDIENLPQQAEETGIHSDNVSETSVDKVNKMNVLIKNYDCPICGKQMSDASARSKHIRRHDGHVAFECEVCHEVFPQIRLIESHVKTHTLRGAKCNVCLLYFADRSSARRHLVKIHGLSPNSNQIEDHMSDCHVEEGLAGYDAALHYNVIDLKKHPNVKLRDCYNSVLSSAVYQRLYETEKIKLDQMYDDLSKSKDDLTIDSPEKLVEAGTNFKTGTESIHDDIEMHINPNFSLNSDITNKRKAPETLNALIEKKFKKEQDELHLPLKITFKREHKETYNDNVDSPKFTIKENEVNLHDDDSGNQISNESDNTVDMDFHDQGEGSDIDNEDVQTSFKAHNQGYLRESLKKDVALLDEEIRKRFLSMPSMFSPMNEMISPTMNISKNGNTIESTFSEDLDTSDNDSALNALKPTEHHCFDCKKNFSSYKTYRNHRRRLHPMTCDICNEKFLDLILYQSHVASHQEATQVRRYDCPVCGKFIKDASSRAKHLRLHTGEKPYSCDICGKRFTQTGHLTSHARLHSGEKPYDCRLCGKFFSEKSSVKRHLRKIHFNEYNKKCDTCGIICATREDWKEHLLSHSLTVYTCKVCEKDFPDSKRLKLHMFNSHDKMTLESRTYACKDCDKYFFSTKGLKNHVKRFHTDDFPTYDCAICSRTFLTTLTLESHMSMHRKKELACITCNKTFRTNGSLSLHKKRHIISLIQKSEKTAESKSIDEKKAKPIESVEHTQSQSDPVIKSELYDVDEKNDKMENDNLALIMNSKCVNIQKLIEDLVLIVTTEATHTNYCVNRPECFLDTGKLQKYLVDNDSESLLQSKPGDQSQDSKPIKTNPRSLNVYKCNSCGLFLTTRKHLMRHIIALHKQKSVKCSMCNSKFSTSILLRAHILRIHDKSSIKQTVKCPLCNKELKDKRNLREHLKRHTGSLPYACSSCPRTFASHSKLTFHMESHNSVRRQCPKCNTKFVHERSYRLHVQAQCLGRRKRAKLNSPKRNVENYTMNYDCAICGRQYRYEESLYLHMKTDHGGIDISVGADNSTGDNTTALETDEFSERLDNSSSVDHLIIQDAIKQELDN